MLYLKDKDHVKFITSGTSYRKYTALISEFVRSDVMVKSKLINSKYFLRVSIDWSCPS